MSDATTWPPILAWQPRLLARDITGIGWRPLTSMATSLAAAHERVYQHSLPLEDVRAQAAYGQHSQVGKILEIHQELPGRIHIVLIRQQVGF